MWSSAKRFVESLASSHSCADAELLLLNQPRLQSQCFFTNTISHDYVLGCFMDRSAPSTADLYCAIDLTSEWVTHADHHHDNMY